MFKNILACIVMLICCEAHAKCRSEYVCDAYGQNCESKQVCDNSYDTITTNTGSVYDAIPKPVENPYAQPQCRDQLINGHWVQVCK